MLHPAALLIGLIYESAKVYPLLEGGQTSCMKLHEFKKRTAEPQNIEYRMSKGGFASLSLF